MKRRARVFTGSHPSLRFTAGGFMTHADLVASSLWCKGLTEELCKTTDGLSERGDDWLGVRVRGQHALIYPRRKSGDAGHASHYSGDFDTLSSVEDHATYTAITDAFFFLRKRWAIWATLQRRLAGTLAMWRCKVPASYPSSKSDVQRARTACTHGFLSWDKVCERRNGHVVGQGSCASIPLPSTCVRQMAPLGCAKSRGSGGSGQNALTVEDGCDRLRAWLVMLNDVRGEDFHRQHRLHAKNGNRSIEE